MVLFHAKNVCLAYRVQTYRMHNNCITLYICWNVSCDYVTVGIPTLTPACVSGRSRRFIAAAVCLQKLLLPSAS